MSVEAQVRYIGNMLVTLNLYPENTGRIVIDTARIVYFWEKENCTCIRLDSGGDPVIFLDVVESVDEIAKALDSE